MGVSWTLFFVTSTRSACLTSRNFCTTSRSLREFPGTESPEAPLVQRPTGFSGMEDQILQPASSELTIRRCHDRMGNPATF